jgi:cephalosporin hydroxylase
MQPAASTERVLAMCDAEEQRVAAKVRAAQKGIPTFFDQLLLQGIARVRQLTASLTGNRQSRVEATAEELSALTAALTAFVDQRGRSRFQTIEARLQTSAAERLPWEVSPYQAAALQGVDECVRWRDRPLFKSACDVAIYPMLLWELKPRTIVELGSGMGGSAIWFSDLLTAFGIDAHVYSIDKVDVAVTYPGVSFVQADCLRIEEALPTAFLRARAHPWLVVEDVHVNTKGILDHVLPFLDVGDYLVVEDAADKGRDIRDALSAQSHRFVVDSRYADFFGRNSTSAIDAVLVRVPDEQ